MSTVTPAEILRLLLIAKGPVTISAEEMDRALGDGAVYKIAVMYDDQNDEYTIELEKE